MELKKKSSDVYVVENDIAIIGPKELSLLKNNINHGNGRIRINVHSTTDDLLHEMFIMILKDSYIRPHKHFQKSEAFHMVYGSAKIIIFYDSGEIERIIPISANSDTYPFYYRLSKPSFHTIIIESDFIIVHEITNGPFIVGETLFAPFSPSEQDEISVKNYQHHLKKMLNREEIL